MKKKQKQLIPFDFLENEVDAQLAFYTSDESTDQDIQDFIDEQIKSINSKDELWLAYFKDQSEWYMYLWLTINEEMYELAHKVRDLIEIKESTLKIVLENFFTLTDQDEERIRQFEKYFKERFLGLILK